MMLHSRMGRVLLTASALAILWVAVAVIFVRLGRRSTVPTATTPVAPRRFDFLSWPTPDAVLVITGQQHGYIEPCGCTEGQLGGLGRRHDLIQRLEQRGWPVGRVDLGGLIQRYGRQAEIKFQTAITALATLGYQAVGLGLGDVNLPAATLMALVVGEHAPVPFVAANLAIFEADVLKPYHRFDVGKVNVGVTAIFGEKYRDQVQSADVQLKEPVASLEMVRASLKDANLRVLLAYAPLEESEALAEQFAEFDLVVTAGGAEEPADPRPLGTDRLLIETGEKGKHVVLVALYGDGQPRFRSEIVPLDSRFSETAEWEEQLAAYVNVLKEEQLVETSFRQPHPDEAEFVGAEACGKCHTAAFAKWEKTKHALATQVLEPKDRHFDPECIRCHATGWDPQLTIPWESGYTSNAATPHLRGNGCENCHGPGSKHVAAEQAVLAGQPPADHLDLRAQMRVDLEYAEKHLCLSCHDADNSHDYKFETYWPQIVHRGVK